MDPFLGQIILFAGNFAPRSWALCEGQLLPINSNQALFSILGTLYGGDGRTTFALPDLRGRVPVSAGDGPGLPSYKQGQKGGVADTVLATANLPAASILIGASDDDASSTEGDNMVLAIPADDKAIYTSTPTDALASGSIRGAANQAFSNMSPAIALNYIICLEGVFPSRS